MPLSKYSLWDLHVCGECELTRLFVGFFHTGQSPQEVSLEKLVSLSKALLLYPISLVIEGHIKFVRVLVLCEKELR